jgi:hypothetical protein
MERNEDAMVFEPLPQQVEGGVEGEIKGVVENPLVEPTEGHVIPEGVDDLMAAMNAQQEEEKSYASGDANPTTNPNPTADPTTDPTTEPNQVASPKATSRSHEGEIEDGPDAESEMEGTNPNPNPNPITNTNPPVNETEQEQEQDITVEAREKAEASLRLLEALKGNLTAEQIAEKDLLLSRLQGKDSDTLKSTLAHAWSASGVHTEQDDAPSKGLEIDTHREKGEEEEKLQVETMEDSPKKGPTQPTTDDPYTLKET